MELHIREYRDSDARVLAGLYFESVRHGAKKHYSKAQREAWAPAVPDPVKFESRLASMIVLVAEDDTGVVGFMTLEDSGYIDLAFVRPDRIGTGVASKIYERIEEASNRLGISRLYSNASEMARPFFERHGWTVDQTKQITLRGVAMTNHRMEKVLK